MKILITGASGMLGSEIVHQLHKQKKQLAISKLIKQRHRQVSGFMSLDLTISQEREKLAHCDWDIVIHTAANRNPDTCETAPTEADEINFRATEFLATETERRGAYMIYISTDYVFSGTNPPYNESSPTGPINYYGKTKLRGEEAVLAASPKNCSVRVPFLYGIQAGIEQAPMLASSIKASFNPDKQYIDDVGIRYPTYTGDVADAVVLLLKHKAAGIYHCSGEDKNTKYSITTTIADMLNLPHAHIHPLPEAAPTAATRPADSHLLTERLKHLGWERPLPFPERLETLKAELVKYCKSI